MRFVAPRAILSIMGLSDNRNESGTQLRSRVAGSLRALGSALDRFDEAVAARLRLHRTDLRCLEIVARFGPLSAGSLAAEAGLSTSAITSVIDRAERAGYCRRTTDTSDRRRVLVEVTNAGRRRGQQTHAGLMQGTNEVLERYSAEELGLLYEFVEAIRSVLVAEADAAAKIPGRSRARSSPRAGR